jgi:uncharacterized membrane protein YcaP (DUF421 family)
MDIVLRSAAVYVLLLLVFRIAGKRTLYETTTFDLVLLLIIGEATQQALVGQDYSLTAAALVIVTLVGLNIGLSELKLRSKRLERLIESTPIVILEQGRPLLDRMHKERIDEADILSAARHLHGLERLDQIKYAILEAHGGITVIPRDENR